MTEPRQLSPLQGESAAPRYVWYASFGSNLHLSRLRYYLAGGCPPGTGRTYPGCRDPRDPLESTAVALPGDVYFAGESPVWTGGVAFYDPGAEGIAAARAHLVSVEQFSDIAAQEMHRDPGADLDLDAVLAAGRLETGPGPYETLVCAGSLDGRPVLTFTAPWCRNDVTCTAPSALYLHQLASGLRESHAWAPERIAEYLSARSGVAGNWAADALLSVCRGEVDAAVTPGDVAEVLPEPVRQPAT